MRIHPLSISGAWRVSAEPHGDPRGMFLEWFRSDRLAELLGHAVGFDQGNLSVSNRGVIRGVHFADVPPGQAKYVSCIRGAVLDVVVDLRLGSPTFGRWEGVHLDDVERTAVYLSEGLGHGFCALTEEATVMYLCSTTYNPEREHAINPRDAALGIAWPAADPIVSPRDLAAPSLDEVRERGLLPSYRACIAYAEARQTSSGSLPSVARTVSGSPPRRT
uniref:NDP-hexose 3,5-epimerase n=1 Tax=uncultured bacterium BAC-AB1442/1414/561 TaxID=1562172 RepID=A0A0C4SD01_9BACT|nr:NDP-hexose 3,5-epimerase [uncultured bacterium BAC-AB1442/1414/561]